MTIAIRTPYCLRPPSHQTLPTTTTLTWLRSIGFGRSSRGVKLRLARSSGSIVGNTDTLDLTTLSSVQPADVFTCAVTANDGVATVNDTTTTTLDNRLPTVGSVAITPNPASISDVLTCTSAVIDPDGGGKSILRMGAGWIARYRLGDLCLCQGGCGDLYGNARRCQWLAVKGPSTLPVSPLEIPLRRSRHSPHRLQWMLQHLLSLHQ